MAGAGETLMERLQSRVQLNPRKIVFPEGEDERILQTARLAVKQKICFPFVLGNKEVISRKASEIGVSLEGVEIIDPPLSNSAQTWGRLWLKG